MVSYGVYAGTKVYGHKMLFPSIPQIYADRGDVVYWILKVKWAYVSKSDSQQCFGSDEQGLPLLVTFGVYPFTLGLPSA